MNKSLNKNLLIIVIIQFFSINNYCQFLKYSNEFLNIGAGAKAMAMGGAQIASTNNAASSYWNPAGLTNIKNNPEITMQHAEYFAGIGKYDFISLAKPIANTKKTIGISLIRFGIDDIPNTLYLVEPDGTINYGNVTTFSSADYAGLFSFANELKINSKRKFSFGINAKIIHRTIGDFAKSWGFGLDAGIQSIGKKGGFGIVAKDVTSTFNSWSYNFSDAAKQTFYLTNNDIPLKSTEITAPRLSIGGFHNFEFNKKLSLQAELSADITFDGKRNTIVSTDFASIDPHFGLELDINKTIFVRSGITNFQKALADKDTLNQKKVWIFQPSVGVGFKLKDFSIDYAFANLANQSEPLYTHIVSISFIMRKQVKTINKK